MEKDNSRRSILKSTGVIGSTQIIVILVGIIRTKILALVLGPLGVGVAGLYQSTIDIVKSATSFGLGFSAVREVAAAATENDQNRIFRTIQVLKRWVWVTGLLGTLITVLFCKTLSKFAFGHDGNAVPIAILSLVILMSQLSFGQLAILGGLRHIKDLAKVNLIGAVASLLISVPLYWYAGEKGIVPAIFLVGLTSLLISWYFSKKVPTEPVKISLRSTFLEGKSMAFLGFFTVVAGFSEVATMFITRAFISKSSGLNLVGQFIAAWTISTLYLSVILNAMGTDYFPRLSGVQNNQEQMNKIVNEQTEVLLLISCPLIISMISFVSYVIQAFYSSSFTETIHILNWQLVGDFFKILSWPIGFAFLAKGKGKVYISITLVWCIIYLLSIFVGWKFWHIEVTGIAFTIAHVVCLLLTFYLSKSVFDFFWSSKVFLYIIYFGPLIILASIFSRLLSQPYNLIAGGVLAVAGVSFAFYHLRNIINIAFLYKKTKQNQ